ncbi:MAG: hypothetical protein IJJ16_00435 [Mogibacterium sp.]|nr:hypothetical protein [Mogibacterium sp.]
MQDKKSAKRERRSFKKLIHYYFDLWLSKGTVSMAVLLFLITGVVILVLSWFIKLFCAARGISFWQAVWQTLTHTLDPGVLAGDDGTRAFLFIMLLATLCGVFFTALLIGVVNDGISSRMNELSKGLEPVIEKDHVVILGFNESTFIIISELIEAYDNQHSKRNAIVIMDKYDKQEMEERIRVQFPYTGNLKIICRSGETYNHADLERCSILNSKSIIVALDNDFETIKTIIACTQMLNESKDSQSFVTAVINHKKNEFAARIAGNDKIDDEDSFSIGNDRLELLMLENTISKIMTHTSRQKGLSKVFIEIFNFSGNEIYIVRNEGMYKDLFEKLDGMTIREINRRLHNAIAIGVIDPDGKIIIDDPGKVALSADSKLIVVEEDDNRIVTGEYVPDPVYDPPTKVYEDKPVTILIMDCNSKLPTVLEEMCNYLTPGSVIHIVADPEELDSLIDDKAIESLNDHNGQPTVTIKRGIKSRDEIPDIYEYKNFENLIDECRPDFLLMMSGMTDDNEEADTRSLNLLLFCKHYKDLHPEADFGVTCEMRNVENQNLADVLMSSDFVVSRNIAALMMSQIAENRELKDVFETLLVSEGYELYIKPASYYMNINGETEVDLFSISEAVAEKQEIFIGYKLNHDGDGDAVLAPDKAKYGKPVTITLHDGDQFVVLAEDITV